MGAMTTMIDGVDTLLAWLGGRLKQNLCDYVDLETASDPETLVAIDGSLMSVIKIDGVRGMVGSANFESDIRRPLNMSLGSYLRERDHGMQFWFSIDKHGIQDDIRRMLGGAFETARTLKLDANDILEERIKNLSRFCALESCYMVLWTKTSALTKSEIKEEKKKAAEKRAEVELPPSGVVPKGQDILRGFAALKERHYSFVNMVEQDFNQNGVAARLMNVREALRAIRCSVDDQFTDSEWEPRLPGDPILPKETRVWQNQKKEDWDLQWPRLGWQICPRDAELVDANVVAIGDKLYAPMYIDLAPKEIRRFDFLFDRLRGQSDTPWRISFMIGGDGMTALKWKQMSIGFLKLASADNKMVALGLQELSEMQMGQETIVKLQMCLATWAEKDQVDLLQKRRQVLARAVEGWGGCEVSEVTGDPVAGVMSSALGLSEKSIATASAAPLNDVLRLLPLNRPSSAWERGAVLFRSPDGKVLPYQPGSSKQSTWISLAFARPGSGKSVLMNVTNFALCLADKLKKLPRIAIIDIGPSSSGLISLIREALPQNQKHLAVYAKLKNDRYHAINIFDTPLGVRFPTPAHRGFLNNMVVLLATDVSKDEPAQGMADLVMDCIDEAYRQSFDSASPKKYAVQIDQEVDEGLAKHRIEIDNKSTWWEVTDALFAAGEVRLATKAQRHAVPRLADLPLMANGDKLRSKYKIKIEGTGEDLIQGFSRMMSNTQDRYPLLAYPTQFDLGDARVIAMDLDEVARGGGKSGERQTQVMYMLGRQATSADFYLNEDDLPNFPAPPEIELPETVPAPAYKLFHKKKIQDIREDLKRVCYDEFHRTGSAAAVRNQILLDMREGRKWKVDIMLASQSVRDFDKEMIGFATNVYIMDPGNADNLNALEEQFGLTPAEKYALANHVHGPSPAGVTFMGRFTTLAGTYSSLLTLTVGALEMWALNTTVESVAIRKRLYERVGPKKARLILARAFPSGSAQSYVEERKAKVKGVGGVLDEKAEENIFDTICDELVKTYGREFAD
jgi:intracellular multiplication protein IcmB